MFVVFTAKFETTYILFVPDLTISLSMLFISCFEDGPEIEPESPN